MKFLCCWFAALLLMPSLYAATINVPAGQPTIQAGINAAANGDTVLVAPGTYAENINFLGKAITVASAKGSKVTIIDGGQRDSVVIFDSKETTTSILRGFTIRNGNAKTYMTGGGISMQFSSAATISGNVIVGNQARLGGGIYAQGGTPLVQRNTINRNMATCGGGSGGGIEFDATYAPQILSNVIENNLAPSGGGAGITLEGLFAPAILINNTIRGNKAQTQGGGIWAYNSDPALVIQNLIFGNSAGEGAGIEWEVPLNVAGPTMVNNTFFGNNLTLGGCGFCLREGSALFLNGFYSQSVLENNLFIAKPGQSAVYCSSDFSSTPPVAMKNDAYSSGGTGFASVCSGATGVGGNLSADPLFTAKGKFTVLPGSPVINAGTNSAPDIPAKDFAGRARIFGGVVDMGAYEFQ